MKKKLITISLILFVLLAIPYVNAETLTRLHGDETKTLYEQTGIISSDNYQKVLKYTDDTAEVLYITNNDISKCCFIKKDDTWILDSWNCISSKSGSASDFTYPFYCYKK